MATIKPEDLKERYAMKKRKKRSQILLFQSIVIGILSVIIVFLLIQRPRASAIEIPVSVNKIQKALISKAEVMSGILLPFQKQELFNGSLLTNQEQQDLGEFYNSRDFDNDLLNTESWFVGAKILSKKIPMGLVDYYERLFKEETQKERKMFIVENLAFLKANVGLGVESFKDASLTAAELGLRFKADIYSKISKGEKLDFTVKEEPIIRSPIISTNKAKPRKLILGRSKIVVTENDVIGAQVDRVNRDWYGKMFNKLPLETPEKEELITYHEGARIKDILSGANAKLKMLSGAIVYNNGSRWFAPDENGVFRFEVLPDKVQYPTSKLFNNVGLLEDTHGISSLVPQAVNQGATLVIGCGDSLSKMQAAAHLAKLGINVYFPCDRYVGELIGYEGTGALIGTAPVKQIGSIVIIGDQPIEIDLGEEIIVEDTDQLYPVQYYDAPKRYFEELQEINDVQLNLTVVKINGLGETYKVTSVAKSRNAHVVAVRVAYEEDYIAVRKWLLKSKKNRAVLFHSAAYDPGYRLFKEFPNQVTFGDPKPVFR